MAFSPMKLEGDLRNLRLYTGRLRSCITLRTKITGLFWSRSLHIPRNDDSCIPSELAKKMSTSLSSITDLASALSASPLYAPMPGVSMMRRWFHSYSRISRVVRGAPLPIVLPLPHVTASRIVLLPAIVRPKSVTVNFSRRSFFLARVSDVFSSSLVTISFNT